MNLNDPFGRMARRHQLAYETMREALRRSNITTEQAAQDVIRQARVRALKFAGIGLAVLLCASLLLPKAGPLFLGIGALLAVWTVTSIVNGRRYIERFIREEINVSTGRQTGNPESGEEGEKSPE